MPWPVPAQTHGRPGPKDVGHSEGDSARLRKEVAAPDLKAGETPSPATSTLKLPSARSQTLRPGASRLPTGGTKALVPSSSWAWPTTPLSPGAVCSPAWPWCLNGVRPHPHAKPVCLSSCRSRPSPLQTQEPGSGRAEPPPPGVKIEPRHGERLPSPHLFHARYLACGISFVRDTHARIP